MFLSAKRIRHVTPLRKLHGQKECYKKAKDKCSILCPGEQVHLWQQRGGLFSFLIRKRIMKGGEKKTILPLVILDSHTIPKLWHLSCSCHTTPTEQAMLDSPRANHNWSSLLSVCSLSIIHPQSLTACYKQGISQAKDCACHTKGCMSAPSYKTKRNLKLFSFSIIIIIIIILTEGTEDAFQQTERPPGAWSSPVLARQHITQ